MPLLLLLSCFTQGPRDWGAVNPLSAPLPPAPRKLGEKELSGQDYAQMLGSAILATWPFWVGTLA
ncbi:MAG TPA: hypothetical protein PKW90_27235, partial [Myxococcota bacterium]|nr:hypothetical protein [Myxococcota bacterium]